MSADNPHHWEFSTRKLSDPKWKGDPGRNLTVEVQSDQPNELVVVLTENFFRSYRGRQREFVAVVRLTGGQHSQTVSLAPGDFKADNGDQLSSWQNVDLLSFRAYYDKSDKLLGSKNWIGPQPVFRKLSWQGR